MASYRVDTRTLNSLLTTTLDAYGTELADVIFGSNFVYHMFKKKGLFSPQDGGAYIRRPVLFAYNTTAAWMSGYDTINVTPQDGMTDSIYPWASLAGAVSISREEERKNSGKSRLINLFEAKMKQLQETLIYKVDQALCTGVGKYNISQTTKQMAGLNAVINPYPGNVDLGGLDGDNAWWQNKVAGNAGTAFTWMYKQRTDSSPATTAPTGVAAMRKLYDACSIGVGGSPDIILASIYTKQAYEEGLAFFQRIQSDTSAQAGFETTKFRGAEMGWTDQILSTDGTTTYITAAEGRATKALAYFINSKTFEVVYDSQSMFSNEGFIKPENQLARTALVVFMANMICNTRRKNGILLDYNATDILFNQ